MKVFGEHWGHPDLERCTVPVGGQCIRCGKLFVDGDLGVVMPFIGATEVSVAAYHRDCLLESLGLESRDRARLRKAKAVLHNPHAYREDILEAIGWLQSTDDPDPEFLQTHDDLQAMLRELET